MARSHRRHPPRAAPDPATLQRALQHAAALLRTDTDQSLWAELADPILYELPDRLNEIGSLLLESLALAAVADCLQQMPGKTAEQPAWLRERSVLMNGQGGVLCEQGDLAGALVAYRESLQVRQRLAVASCPAFRTERVPAPRKNREDIERTTPQA